MQKKIKVAFLIDNNNNWIEKYLKKSILIKKNKKFSSKIYSNYKQIKNNEIVFILNYTKILNSNFLKKNKLNLVLHASNLPKGRGFAPLQWQILKKKNKIIMTLFEAVKNVDSGKIFAKDQIKLNGTELYDEIRYIEAKIMIKMVKKFLKRYPKVSSKKQIGKPTYYKKRYPSDSELNINFSIKKLFNQMRIANNDEWPSFFYFKNKKFIIKIFKDK